MADIHIDIIDPEYGAHLLHNRRASSLYTIGPQDFIDMVRVDIVDIDEWISGTGESPKTSDIRPIGGQLRQER